MVRKPQSDLSTASGIGSDPSRAWMRQERDNKGKLQRRSKFTAEPEQNSALDSRHRVRSHTRARGACLQSREREGETSVNGQAFLNNWVSFENEKCVS